MNLDNMSIAEIWTLIDTTLNGNPGPIQGMNTTYSLNLSGDDGGSFGLIFKDGKAETLSGEIADADCALTMSVKDFKKLLAGKLNSTGAFMMGKLKVKGNIGLALKLESLLKQYQF
ncbi:SCP2 sterol-binding domain-containing protein [Sporosarcina sp. USHLN248]|uniref:SCP2 sterol-binding domain-containing protein n=1 Tax=Sporosarcina sp. USHLN248 TaxID=3081300 RepID=UPI0030186E1F